MCEIWQKLNFTHSTLKLKDIAVKKIVFLLSFLAFAWAESNEWMNKWANPSNDETKASQSEIKSVAYYKQNKDEARKMTDKCLGKRMMVIGQLSESELAHFNSDEEMEKFIIKKWEKRFGKIVKMLSNRFKIARKI